MAQQKKAAEQILFNFSNGTSYAEKVDEEIRSLNPKEAAQEYAKLKREIKNNYDAWAKTNDSEETRRLADEGVQLKLKKNHLEMLLRNRTGLDYSGGKISRDEAKKRYTECGRSPKYAEEILGNIDNGRLFFLPPPPLRLYLEGIRIDKIDGFKREMKIMTQRFPEEFGGDSMKCAGAILDSVNEETRDKIDSGLRALGCTNPVKTKRLTDSWAANGIQSPAKDLRVIRSREKQESLGR
jgi:hypothetical protein